MKKKFILTMVLFFLFPLNIIYSEEKTKTEPGRSPAILFDMGINGEFSIFEVGMHFPFQNKNLFINIRTRAMSALNWVTYSDYSTGQMTSFHPVVAGGVISFGGFSPLIYEYFRAYGGMDLLIGYTFTPYDDAINHTGNLVGDNITYGIFGYFGVEFYTSPKISVFLESGGGFKNLYSNNKTDINVIAASWIGSGFTFRMGMNFYL